MRPHVKYNNATFNLHGEQADKLGEIRAKIKQVVDM
jgi:hypothetical protein